jgi:phenylpropionate dioxygenase-like ring-hydroxylating dioxygenase large terminal subunit
LIDKLVLMGSAALKTERNESLHPVESYTVAECQGIVWIWTGEGRPANRN